MESRLALNPFFFYFFLICTQGLLGSYLTLYLGVFMAFPEFMARKEVVLELTLEELEAFLSANFIRDAKLVEKDGKLYLLIPLDLFFMYEKKDNKIVVKIPVSK